MEKSKETTWHNRKLFPIISQILRTSGPTGNNYGERNGEFIFVFWEHYVSNDAEVVDEVNHAIVSE